MDVDPPVPTDDALLVGVPRRWSRDLAVVGALTGALAPWVVIANLPFTLGAAVAGALGGWVLGQRLPLAVERLRGRHSLAWVAAIAAWSGLAWGAASGGIGGAAMAVVGGEFLHATGDELVALGLICGGVSGAIQLVVLLPPYLALSTLRRPTWPVVLAAPLVVPLLAYASMVAVMALPVVVVVGLMAFGFVGAALGVAEEEAVARRDSMRDGR